MSTSNLVSPVQKAAAEEYEYYGSTIVLNTTLKFVCLFMGLALAVQGFVIKRLSKVAETPQRIYIRVSEDGRPRVTSEKESRLTIQPNDIKFFLGMFVSNHFGRDHQTVKKQYSESLYFLSKDLFDRINEENRKTMWMPKFLASTDPDIDIQIRNIIPEPGATDPYRARVDFDKIFSTPQTSEKKRERWSGEFLFRVNPDVADEFVLHNPLGFQITHLVVAPEFK